MKIVKLIIAFTITKVIKIAIKNSNSNNSEYI